MKRLIYLGILVFSFNSYGQYPTWMPMELKNKAFCGEFNVTGKLIQGNTVFMDVPYELSVTEEGVQLRINPGAKFRREEWGETIKVLYKTSNIIVKNDQFRTYYTIDLSSSNETKDSPVFPKYTLKKLEFQISNYDGHELSREEQRKFSWGWWSDNGKPAGHSIDFSVSVPYYDAGGPGATFKEATVCKTFKSKKELAEEKKQAEIREKKIKDLIKEIDALIPLNIIEASEKWDVNKDLLLSSSLATNTLNNLISNLNNYYADTIVNIDAYVTEGEIQKNSVLLKSISDGNYEITVNQAKKTTQPSDFKDFQISKLPKDKLSGACCNVIKPYSFNVKLSSQDSILVETKYFSSSKKPIFIKDEKTFCFKSKSILSTVNFVFDPTIPKGQIRIEKTYKYEKYANGLVIDIRQYNKSENIVVLKKHKG
jgi:hypothetical protein